MDIPLKQIALSMMNLRARPPHLLELRRVLTHIFWKKSKIFTNECARICLYMKQIALWMMSLRARFVSTFGGFTDKFSHIHSFQNIWVKTRRRTSKCGVPCAQIHYRCDGFARTLSRTVSTFGGFTHSFGGPCAQIHHRKFDLFLVKTNCCTFILKDAVLFFSEYKSQNPPKVEQERGHVAQNSSSIMRFVPCKRLTWKRRVAY